MEKRIFTIRRAHDLERAFTVLKDLRPHLQLSDFKKIFADAQANSGYQLIAYEVSGKIVALMGYRFLSDFVRGRHLYIDDLISIAGQRSKGIGAELLNHAESIAVESNCKILRLCTGIENDRGITFYERNGWVKRAYAYTKLV